MRRTTYAGLEDVAQISDCTIESRDTLDVCDGGESLELAGLILSHVESVLSSSGEGSYWERKSSVQEGVDGVDIGVPLGD